MNPDAKKPEPTLAELVEKSKRLRAQADRINREMKDVEAIILEIALKAEAKESRQKKKA